MQITVCGYYEQTWKQATKDHPAALSVKRLSWGKWFYCILHRRTLTPFFVEKEFDKKKD